MQNPVKFILVVEDDPSLSMVMSRHLTALGYMVLTAASFREAADQLAVRPALLVLDIALPDATGWDVAAWLESVQQAVPIVVISGRPPLAAGMTRFHPVAFLLKPFAIGDLVQVIQTHVPAPVGAFGA
ncbi:MAG: response regulator [Chloroflexota bacterium]|nr:response regulator [Chloroflexota bacterium]